VRENKAALRKLWYCAAAQLSILEGTLVRHVGGDTYSTDANVSVCLHFV